MKRFILCAFLGTLCGTTMYAQEQGNKAEFVVSNDKKTLTIKGHGDLTEVSNLSTDLINKLKAGQYETVTFENEGTAPLYIDGSIINAIVFGNPNGGESFNSCMTTLDLGQTTCKDPAQVYSFQTICDLNASGYKGIKLTYPQSEDGVFDFPAARYGGNGVGYITSVVIPEGYKTIAKKAFYGYKSLSDVTFPSTLDKIEDCAFMNDNALRTLNLNEGLRYIGNGAFGWSGNDNTSLGTLKIPSTVRYIGPAAFQWREYGDIYFTSPVAPLMPVGTCPDLHVDSDATAFSANTQYGNNGFNSSKTEGTTSDAAATTGYANRENYKNGSYYFAIIHYPQGLTDEQASTYTDITRNYQTISEDQTWNGVNNKVKVGKETLPLIYNNQGVYTTVVAVGYKDTYVDSAYIWPSQDQWMRAYVTAGCGVAYDGVTPYTVDLSEEDLAILKEAGYDIDNEMVLAKLKTTAHHGTRLFVLANGDATKGSDYPIAMKGGQWWTLCVPFDMTRKQVEETFGEGTEVCIFNQVERNISVDGEGAETVKGITLKFKTSAMDNKLEKNENGTWTMTDASMTDDDVVIKAHESYMIHPTGNPEDAVFVVKNYKPSVGAPQPTIVTSTNKYDYTQDDEGVPYRFVGNYNTDVMLPQYSYVFAKTAADPSYKFWFYTGTSNTWKPNKSIVEVAYLDGGSDDYDTFFNVESGKTTKQVSLFGNAEDVTEIEAPKVTIKAGVNADAPIYSLDGRLVSSNGDTDNLAKGIYVQAGKKFVVK